MTAEDMADAEPLFEAVEESPPEDAVPMEGEPFAWHTRFIR